MKMIFFLAIMIVGVMERLLGNDPGSAPSEFYLYVGAYTENAEQGISIYKFDANQGGLSFIATEKNVKNPSYLAINDKNNLLVAANEVGEYHGKKTGYVTSFSINSETGGLTKINEVASGGGAPCYVTVNKSASHAFVSNYSGGNVSIIPIQSDGRLSEYSDLKQHEGTGGNPARQKGPHAHFIELDPKQEFAIAVDLGMDKIISYKIDEKQGLLNESNQFSVQAGAGPRHLTFHPNKRLVFVISELNSTISSLSYDSKEGKFSEVMTVSTLPDDFNGTSYCADIHVSPNGKYVYGSNRGHNSIVVYQVDVKSGKLSYVDHTSVKGDWPRNFLIDPTGKFLLVANQKSDNIVVFKIDQESGRLRSNGVEVQLPKPVCLKMLAIR